MPSTTFLTSLRDVGVSHANFSTSIILLFAVGLWTLPAVLYSIGIYRANDEGEFAQRVVWSTNLGIHVVSGLLVDMDALYAHGRYWPLQMWIIGLSLYATLTLPGLFAVAIAKDDDADVLIALAALAVACLADAAMVSILFEFFHRTRSTSPLSSVSLTVSPSSARSFAQRPPDSAAAAERSASQRRV